MKRTDLEKLKGLKVSGEMRRAETPGRYGRDAAAVANRREQRKLDQAKGLVPFAVKLDRELIERLRALATRREATLDDTVAELLRKSLED